MNRVKNDLIYYVIALVLGGVFSPIIFYFGLIIEYVINIIGFLFGVTTDPWKYHLTPLTAWIVYSVIITVIMIGSWIESGVKMENILTYKSGKEIAKERASSSQKIYIKDLRQNRSGNNQNHRKLKEIFTSTQINEFNNFCNTIEQKLQRKYDAKVLTSDNANEIMRSEIKGWLKKRKINKRDTEDILFELRLL